MSSIAARFGVKKEGLTRFIKPESPTYYNGDIDVLFPFIYENGVLDITYNGNNFKTIMVDSVNQSPDNETETVIRMMGGPYLVSSLGNNFKDYIRAWRSGIIDTDSPIEIYIAPQIYRVQEGSHANINADSDIYTISTEAPSNDNYITGDITNNYNTNYIFKTPLTFTVIESGVKKYITFRTILDQE